MKQITKSQYLTLTGIKALADQHEKSLKELVKATTEITGEEDDMGHSSDFVYGSRELDDMLDILEIEVVDEHREASLEKMLHLNLEEVLYKVGKAGLGEYTPDSIVPSYLFKGAEGNAYFVYHPSDDNTDTCIDVCEYNEELDLYEPVDGELYQNL